MLVVIVILLGGLGGASLIAIRSYRAAHFLINATPPSTLFEKPADAIVANMQSVSFQSDGLRVAGWYIPSKNHAAIIVVHGVAADRATMLSEIRLLAAAGYGVLAFDWPGLGQSEGHIYWGAQARNALVSAISWMSARPDIDAGRIGGIGFSMGGFILTQVAADDPRLRAIVIEAAASEFDGYIHFHSGKWGILSEWPARWALRNSGLFSAKDTAVGRIAEISPRPVMIIGQTGDPNVPESMLRSLEAAARQPKSLWLINGSEHGSYEHAAGAEYAGRLDAFFKDNLR